MTTGITLEIPAKAEYLSLVRAVVVSAAALDPAFEDQRLEDLRLAVSEATTKCYSFTCKSGFRRTNNYKVRSYR